MRIHLLGLAFGDVLAVLHLAIEAAALAVVEGVGLAKVATALPSRTGPDSQATEVEARG